ncbi:MAG: shikimate dehydrogenase [Burkholderiaceae bacterium]|jgi:shikimate dehydrogenase|nr:shikimate dehydrogenase [Burkholderiales bacterium]MCA3214755.1 shikimate dehydrogenase [Burkholderiales bacterium]MCE2644257.1 shikimate dehydrogenase [Burkholderiaceae bacterium]
MTRSSRSSSAVAAAPTVARYAVVGNPIQHSLSPQIHALFADKCRQQMTYEKLLAPLDGFEEFALGLRDVGYAGLNVTIPFKLDAAKLADELTPRARLAGAVNTLKFDGDAIFGDNTDGIGFVRDVQDRLKFALQDAAVLILGAGGGVRGLIGALLEEKPRWIAVANRTHGRAQELADEFGVEALTFDEVPAEHFDLVINGTPTGLHAQAPNIDPETFDDCTLAYDLVYDAHPTPFMELARRGGAKVVSDGLGMLIEQAAEAFLVWRGVRPETLPVYRELRRGLDAMVPAAAVAGR